MKLKMDNLPENISAPTKDRSFIKCQTGQIADVVRKSCIKCGEKGLFT